MRGAGGAARDGHVDVRESGESREQIRRHVSDGGRAGGDRGGHGDVRARAAGARRDILR